MVGKPLNVQRVASFDVGLKGVHHICERGEKIFFVIDYGHAVYQMKGFN